MSTMFVTVLSFFAPIILGIAVLVAANLLPRSAEVEDSANVLLSIVGWVLIVLGLVVILGIGMGLVQPAASGSVIRSVAG